MEAEAIVASKNVGELQTRHRALLQMVEDFRQGKKTELTETAAVAEKIRIKTRLRELGATIRPETRTSTTTAGQQIVKLGGKA